MTDDAGLEPPVSPAIIGDRAHALARGVISAVPLAGGPAAELFNMIVPASLERRREDWFQLVARKLGELDERGVDLSQLASDEGFLTIVIEATKAALGTHLETKLELLASCVESAALPESRDDLMAMRFLQYVEELSPEHFVVLTYLADPGGWFARRNIAPPSIYAGPRRASLDASQIGVDDEVLDLVLGDLGSRGLASVGMLGGVVSGSAQLDPLATPRGHQLLEFVRLI